MWVAMTPPQLNDFTFDPNGILKFQLQNWLAGHEYSFMLRHYRAYLQCYPEKIEIAERSHPLSIYESPKPGQVYFIRGWHLREFGFPRDLDLVKRYKWKKMNFTTDLPKKNPLCTYLVAGAAFDNTQLRMHVVCFAKCMSSCEVKVFVEYSVKYRNPEILKHLRFSRDKAKLLDEDIETNSGRILLCHITRVGTPPAAGCQLARSNGCRRKRMKCVKTKSRRGKKNAEDYESDEGEKERNYLSDYTESEEGESLPFAPRPLKILKPTGALRLKAIKKKKMSSFCFQDDMPETQPLRKPVDFKQCAQTDAQARKLQNQYDRLFTCRLEDQQSKRDRQKQA